MLEVREVRGRHRQPRREFALLQAVFGAQFPYGLAEADHRSAQFEKSEDGIIPVPEPRRVSTGPSPRTPSPAPSTIECSEPRRPERAPDWLGWPQACGVPGPSSGSVDAAWPSAGRGAWAQPRTPGARGWPQLRGRPPASRSSSASASPTPPFSDLDLPGPNKKAGGGTSPSSRSSKGPGRPWRGPLRHSERTTPSDFPADPIVRWHSLRRSKGYGVLVRVRLALHPWPSLRSGPKVASDDVIHQEGPNRESRG